MSEEERWAFNAHRCAHATTPTIACAALAGKGSAGSSHGGRKDRRRGPDPVRYSFLPILTEGLTLTGIVPDATFPRLLKGRLAEAGVLHAAPQHVGWRKEGESLLAALA